MHLTEEEDALVLKALRAYVAPSASGEWVAVEKAKADAYEAAAVICEGMSYPPEGRDRWANKEEEWAAIKLEDAAKAIRERKARVCHVTLASVGPTADKKNDELNRLSGPGIRKT